MGPRCPAVGLSESESVHPRTRLLLLWVVPFAETAYAGVLLTVSANEMDDGARTVSHLDLGGH